MGLRDWLQRRAEGQSAGQGTAARRPARRPAGHNPKRAPARWFTAAEPVTVAGLTIPGMVYAGKGLPSISQWRGPEPALINPALPVEVRRADWQGQSMDYWPSYDQITPAARGAYLSWLANGRGEGAYVGYVFLFFYGLERRALVDAQTDPAAEAELPAVRAEVERLLALYGESRSFHRYASAFLDIIDVMMATGRAYDRPPPDAVNWWELPAGLKLGLGHLAEDAKPVPATWAMAWVRAHPETRMRTAARRCATEFTTLFEHHYKARHGDGLVLKPGKKRLTITYNPGSASFGGPVELTAGAVPDVYEQATPLRRLTEIAELCTQALDGYSRWLGRHPDGAGTLAGAALLPPELLDNAPVPAVDAVRSWADSRLNQAPWVVIDGQELLAHWPGAPSKLKKTDAVALCGLLDRLGCGIEPDARFGGGPLEAGTAVLFRAERAATPGDGYAAATVLAHLAAAVSAADGTVSDAEQDHLASVVESALHLTDAERRRLHAHLAWLHVAKPGLGGMKKRLEALDPAQRSEIGRLLVTLAGADGTVAPAEVTILLKVFKLLGIDPNEVYSQLHALGAPDAGPVVVRPARPGRPGEPVPAAPRAGAVTLDPERVRARLADSEEVAALLASVFVEDEPVAAPPPAVDDDGVSGLDAAHSAFVRLLATKPRWDPDEVDAAAASLGLLPAGALDVVNEAAIELSDEPLCDRDDDGVEINGYALSELLR